MRGDLQGQPGPTEMLEVSFRDEVGPFDAALETSAGVADQTAIALAAEESLDDICDQIRMLRSAVYPVSLPGTKEWPLDMIACARTPENAGTFRQPQSHDRAMSAASMSCTIGGFSSQRHGARPLNKFNEPQKLSTQDTLRDAPAHTLFNSRERPPDESSGIPSHAPSLMSPLPLRHTMWQERQMELCFQRWCEFHKSIKSPRSLASVSVEPTPTIGLDGRTVCSCGNVCAPGAVFCQTCVARRHPSHHPTPSSHALEAHLRRVLAVWHRVCKSRHAEELALSLRLLDSQVSKQLRRGLARWWTWSQASMGRKAVYKHQMFLRRFNLKHWRQVAATAVEKRAVRDQVCALLRAWFLRHSARLWATRTKSLKRHRFFFHRAGLARLRWTFRAWQFLPECLRVRSQQASINADLLLKMAKRTAILWWSQHSKAPHRHRALISCHQRVVLDRSQRDALCRLAHHAQRIRKLGRSRRFAEMRRERRCQAAALHAWARWSFRKLQLRRRYQGHLATRIRREMLPIFEQWVSTARREQRHHAALQRAAIVTTLSLKRRTFHFWHTTTVSRRKGMAVLLALAAPPLPLFFKSWIMAVSDLKEERNSALLAKGHHSEGILRRLMKYFILGIAASKLEKQQGDTADTNAKKLVSARCWQLWRSGVLRARIEREQSVRAVNRHACCLNIQTFNCWRTNVAAHRTERQLHGVADSSQRIRLLRRAWSSWSRFSAFQRHKRHEPQACRCIKSIATLRRRQHLQKWAQVFSTVQRHRHAVHLRNSSAMRAFFGWGMLAQQRRAHVIELEVAHLRRRRSEHAGRVWHGWACHVSEALAMIEDKMVLAREHHGRGVMQMALWGLHMTVLHNTALRGQITRLMDALQVLVRAGQLEAQQWSMNNFCDWVEDCRNRDAHELELENLALRQICFEYWSGYCQHVNNKRIVHELCDRHRFSRLLARTFEGWRLTQLHLADVIQAVHYWVVGLEAQWALELLEIWRDWAQRCRNCKRFGAQLIASRQQRVLNTWLTSLRKQQTTWLLMQRSFHNQRSSCFFGWREHTASRSLRRRRHKVLIEAVHCSRRRRWIDQWCESGRWNRLNHVAMSWDNKSFTTRWFASVFQAWAGTLALLERAREGAKRVAALRRQLHVRVWKELTRMFFMHRRFMAKHSISQWKEVVARGKVELHAASRIQRMRKERAFGILRELRLDHRWQRLDFEQRCTDIASALCRLRHKRAVATWKSWTNCAKHGRLRGKTAESKCSALRQKKQQRFLCIWLERWKERGPGADSLEPGDGQEIVHQPDGANDGRSPARAAPQPQVLPKLRIIIQGARDLHETKSSPFCVCEVPEAPQAKFQTKTDNSGTANPIWNETYELSNYKVGQPLIFTVMDKESWPKQDVRVGVRALEFDDFYPFGFSGEIDLENADQDQPAGNVGTLCVLIDVVDAPHCRLRRAVPTVAKAISSAPDHNANVPTTIPELILRFFFTAWLKHVNRMVDVATPKALLERKTKDKKDALRASVFHHWVEAYDHLASTKIGNNVLQRKRGLRIIRAWAKFVSFHKRFKLHVDHMQILRNTQSVRACFDRWHEALREHYHVAVMWLERWRHWSSALLLAWRGFVRERHRLRRSLRDLRQGAKFMQKCRKADLMVLCWLSALLRECFTKYAHWTSNQVLLRDRAAQLQKQVTDGRQRRRLRSWIVCGRSLQQEDDERRLVPLRSLLVDLPLSCGADLLDEQSFTRLSGIMFALWAEVASTMRPFRQASRAFIVAASAQRRSRGLSSWRSWVRMRRHHRLTLRKHCSRWGASTLMPFTRAWHLLVHRTHAVAAKCISNDICALRDTWHCWLSEVDRSKKARRVSAAFRGMRQTQETREILRSWAVRAARDSRVRRFVHVLDAVQRRWVSEDAWSKEASADTTLQAMFCRFATAFNSSRTKLVPSLHRDDGFHTVLALIWSRQQLAVALARLRGNCQAWMLNMWPVGLATLLSPDSDEYAQAEQRLPLMIAALEEQGSLAYATCLVKASKQRSGQPVDNRSMWCALADLLVVYLPGWPRQSRQPVSQLAQRHCLQPCSQVNSSALQLPDATPRFGVCRGGGIGKPSFGPASLEPREHGKHMTALLSRECAVVA